MDIQVTVQQACIIRAGTFSPGDDDRKRKARDLRRKINAALQPWADAKKLTLMDFGNFAPSAPNILNETLTLIFDAKEWAALYQGVKGFPWGVISEAMEDAILDLTDAMKDWPAQAEALENVEKLPKDKRDAVLAMQKQSRKRALPKQGAEVSHDAE